MLENAAETIADEWALLKSAAMVRLAETFTLDNDCTHRILESRMHAQIRVPDKSEGIEGGAEAISEKWSGETEDGRLTQGMRGRLFLSCKRPRHSISYMRARCLRK